MIARALLIAGLSLVAAVATATAQSPCTAGNGASKSCTVTSTITMVVGKTTRLEVGSTSLTLFNNTVSATDYVAGSKTAGSLSFTLRANAAANVTLSAATANFGYAGSASPAPTKSVSTLQWSSNNGSSWNNMTTTGAQIATAAAATSGTTPAQPITFRTLLGWTSDPPGTYTVTLNLTITAP